MINKRGSSSFGCSISGCVSNGSNTMSVFCDCVTSFDRGCLEQDPLIFNLEDSRITLTNRSEGSYFDLNADGKAEKTAWTHGASEVAFLALDRDRNGVIDSGRELFGDATPQLPSNTPNGFRALSVFDDRLSGGNADGMITAEDQIYDYLLVWVDRDHDGVSQGDELSHLVGHHITMIDLRYQGSSRVDQHGNAFRYRSRLVRNEQVHAVWNVFFLSTE